MSTQTLSPIRVPQCSTTAVRTAYGVFFNQPVTNIVTALGSNPPFRTTIDYDNVTVANLFGAAGAARAPVLTTVNRNFTSDYVQQWNLNVQHQVLSNGMADRRRWNVPIGKPNVPDFDR